MWKGVVIPKACRHSYWLRGHATFELRNVYSSIFAKTKSSRSHFSLFVWGPDRVEQKNRSWKFRDLKCALKDLPDFFMYFSSPVKIVTYLLTGRIQELEYAYRYSVWATEISVFISFTDRQTVVWLPVALHLFSIIMICTYIYIFTKKIIIGGYISREYRLHLVHTTASSTLSLKE